MEVDDEEGIRRFDDRSYRFEWGFSGSAAGALKSRTCRGADAADSDAA